MDLSVISTYRCNSHCSMCNIWKSPSLPSEEISLTTLEKIPYGFDNLNITGGEPTLRNDLLEMVDILHSRARVLEISSNGLHPERLESIIKKYPDIKVRFSLDGFAETSNRIRGEINGFNIKVSGLKRLQNLGGRDLGFAITIQDDNVQDLVRLYQFSEKNRFELSTSTLHNGFQFHKSDNTPYDRIRLSHGIEGLIMTQLNTNVVKNWFRAYLNLGLIAKVLGQDRLIPCTAATDFIFIDPWSEVYACNVRPDLNIGNLELQNWNELIEGPKIQDIRQKVALCTQNCWMVGSARTAMRNTRFTKFPKFIPLLWVIENKIRVTLGLPIQFNKYIDYKNIHKDKQLVIRDSYLGKTIKPTVDTKDQVHYPENYENH